MNKGFFAYIFLFPLSAVKERLWGEEPGWHKEMEGRRARARIEQEIEDEELFEEYMRARIQAFREYKRKKKKRIKRNEK